MVYDWIVIGNGITGAAVSYELARLGLSVLVVERDHNPRSATRHSYGGIAYWSGTTPLMQQLCREGIQRHRTLTDELGQSTEFRELDLLLTVPVDSDGNELARVYAACEIPPQLISREQALDMEPLLNGDAIAAALTVRHGHVHPNKLVQAYNHRFRQAKGILHFGNVTGLLYKGSHVSQQTSPDHTQVTGIITPTEEFYSQNVVVCSGGWSHHFFKTLGIPLRQYFTHAESVELSPTDLQLQTLIMPANLQRFTLETRASHDRRQPEWDKSDSEIEPYILDAGAIQFQDGTVRIGQISRVLTNPCTPINAPHSEQEIRSNVGQMLPCLQSLPGKWCQSLVAFSGDGLPLIGTLPQVKGLYVFSGFSNPFTLVPPLAQHFATHMTTPNSHTHTVIDPCQPDRSSTLPSKK